MNFFENQDKARRQTRTLVIYFILAVLAIVLTINFLIIGGLKIAGRSQSQSRSHHSSRIYFGEAPRHGEVVAAPIRWWQPGIFLPVTAVTLLVIGGGTAYKLMALSQGGSAVAAMFNATPLPPNSPDPQNRKLQNVVEEMAIASGVPVPGIYVMEDEEGINAFAAGYSPQDAVVAVTRGCLTRLTRDELQGVIAHEFSHILNGDMRLNIRLIGVLHGILLISLIGYGILRTLGSVRIRSSGKNKDSGAAAIIAILALGVILIVVGSLGFLFGRLIQAAVSRQREFLADASAVQFTRNPAGIAGALRKIAGYSSGSKIANHNALEVSHMFFAGAMGFSFAELFATHPPIAERIRAIDPMLAANLPAASAVREEPAEDQAEVPVSRLSSQPSPLPAEKIVSQVGTPQPSHICWATEFLTDIPPVLAEAAHEPFSARPILFALLMSGDPAIRQKQKTLILRQLDMNTLAELGKLLPLIDPLPAGTRLTLVDLAAPALRQLSPPQAEAFQGILKALIEADGKLSLFEYAVQKITLRYLSEANAPTRAAAAYYSIKPLLPDVAVLLQALATAGSNDPAKLQAAFDAGAARLAGSGTITRPEQLSFPLIDQSLNRLTQASPPIKMRIVDACAYAVAADGVVELREAELLRAITSTLGCPMPPMLAHP